MQPKAKCSNINLAGAALIEIVTGAVIEMHSVLS